MNPAARKIKAKANFKGVLGSLPLLFSQGHKGATNNARITTRPAAKNY